MASWAVEAQRLRHNALPWQDRMGRLVRTAIQALFLKAAQPGAWGQNAEILRAAAAFCVLVCSMLIGKSVGNGAFRNASGARAARGATAMLLGRIAEGDRDPAISISFHRSLGSVQGSA